VTSADKTYPLLKQAGLGISCNYLHGHSGRGRSPRTRESRQGENPCGTGFRVRRFAVVPE